MYAGVSVPGAALDASVSSASEAGRYALSVTVGYLVCAAICIPLCRASMEENMMVQYLSFAFLVASIIAMAGAALLRVVDSAVASSPPLPPLEMHAATASSPAFATLAEDDEAAGEEALLSVSPSVSLARGALAPRTLRIVADSVSSAAAAFAAVVVADASHRLRLRGSRGPASRYASRGAAAASSGDEDALQGKKARREFSPKRFFPSPPPLVGRSFSQLFSTFIASYSYVTVVPCWANEVKPHVEVRKKKKRKKKSPEHACVSAGVLIGGQWWGAEKTDEEEYFVFPVYAQIEKAVWRSSAFCCAVYFLFGILLAAAYPSVSSDNILQASL